MPPAIRSPARGPKIGPQLDGIGVRGLDRLLEDVLDPNRNVDQAFRATTLTLKNGQSLTGLVLREEGAVIVLADAQGKEQRIVQGSGRRARGVAALADAGELGRPDSRRRILRPDGVFAGAERQIMLSDAAEASSPNASRSVENGPMAHYFKFKSVADIAAETVPPRARPALFRRLLAALSPGSPSARSRPAMPCASSRWKAAMARSTASPAN